MAQLRLLGDVFAAATWLSIGWVLAHEWRGQRRDEGQREIDQLTRKDRRDVHA